VKEREKERLTDNENADQSEEAKLELAIVKQKIGQVRSEQCINAARSAD